MNTQNTSFPLFLLENSIALAQDILIEYANQPDYIEQLQSVFNTSIHNLDLNWRANHFAFPEITIVSSEQINGANGAFSFQTNKIYLSQDFLLVNQSNTHIIASVILEEYGHYLDSQLNSIDTPGDEGAIFSALVRGEELSDEELQQVQNEDDTAIALIDGESIAIEQNIEDITFYSRSINFNQGDRFDFDFRTADYVNRWFGLNIPNNYTYSSGNDFIPRFNFGGNTYSTGGGFGISGASLNANAGLTVFPGFFEAGLEVNAGYNLGEFNLDFGSLQTSIDAGIRNNQFDININTNVELPNFDYILPYAYANLDAVLGYDFRVDGFLNGEAKVEIGGSVGRFFGGNIRLASYSGGLNTTLVNQRNRYERTLVNLDTRSDNNYIDYIIDRIDLNSDEGSVPRSQTGGYLGFDFELPSFENTFRPISLSNPNSNFPTITSPDDEYLWEISEETTLAEANLALDSLLAEIPILAWLSQTDSESTSIYDYNFGLQYDWRALALDLSADLNFGYSFKIGITDLLPQFDAERSEISSLDLESESFTSIDELTTYLVGLDNDDGNDIDIWLEYDPTIIFEAEAYLRPELNFDWDVGVFNADLILANRPYGIDFTVREGESTNLASTTIDIIAPIRREIKFSEIYSWLNNGVRPNFTQYNLEIPFSDLDPDMFGDDEDNFFAGSSEDDNYMAGEGNDRIVVSEGSNDILAGDGGTDTLILDRPQTYNVNSNTITDDAGNRTEFSTFELLELAGADLPSAIVVTGNSTPLEVLGIATNGNDRIENITIQNLQTVDGNDVIQGIWNGQNIDSGAGDDVVTLSKTQDFLRETILNVGTGDDTVNFTIVPQGFGTIFESPPLYEIDLGSGNDSLTVRIAEPIFTRGSNITNSLIVANGEVGGKIIDLPLLNEYVFSRANLTVEASDLRELFALDTETEIDRLFVDIADSSISYTLDDTNPEAPSITDEIIQADKVTLDITDPLLPTSIRVDLENFNTNTFNIEADNSAFTEVILNTSNITDIPNTANLEVNGFYTVVKVDRVDETTINFLESNLIGEFRAIDFSSIEGGVSITNDFIPPDSADELDVFELTFGDEADTVLFTPDSSQVSEVGGDFNQQLIGLENLMSFELGAGDDRFHDRPGTKDSEIYPGLGNDSIYGAGGYDTVHYPQGSRLDYEITVIDDRTIEVYYRPDDTTDILIDVEEVDFDGADEFVFNPYWQGPNIVDNSSYTTFTLQVFAENDWNQPPFIYAPWTNLVPKGTTQITLTKEFLLSNIVDPEGKEAELEISFFDTYATDDSLNFEIDSTNENADSWQITIPDGLNNEEQAIIVDYMVFDEPSGSDQGNTLYIYPSEELNYALAIAPINLTTSPESEILTATPFDDVLALNDGDDIVEGLAGNDLLQGQNGNDSLNGGEGDDSLIGGAGDDTLVGHLGEGNDEYDGGEGNDVLSYEDTNTPLNANLQTGIVQNGETEEDRFTNIENFLGSQTADTIIGSEADNSISGLAGNDIIEGREGNDILEGRDGNDTLSGGENSDLLIGGEGNDLYSSTLDDASGDIIEDTAGENDTLSLFIEANQPATLALNEPTTEQIGINRTGTALIIDINSDGAIDSEDDLSILNFFNESSTGAGNGFIENVANLSGNDILNFLPPNESNSVNENEEGNNNNQTILGSTVYRFFNPNAGVHFYTASEVERDVVLELPNYTFEGESYNTVDPLSGEAEDVYRFFNTNTGVHLYTTNENERDSIIENLPEFTFEGTAFSAYETEVEATIPIYRFFNGTTGAHFYTPSVVERDSVEENLPDFQFEGIAYYAFPLSETTT